MKKLMLNLLLLSILVLSVYCRNANRQDTVDAAKESNEQKENVLEDQSDFLVNAASAGHMEVEMGQLAQEKANHNRVKAFGKMMVDQHSQVNQEIKNLASGKQITLPSGMGAEHQRDMDDLRKLSGRDFDRKYMDMMVEDHEKDIRKFEDASENHKDAEIQTFAAKTLPKLRAHLDSARMVKSVILQNK